MTSIDLIRAVSVINLAVWIAAAGLTVPVLWRAHPREHPLIALLLILACVDLAVAALFVDSAWMIRVIRPGHGTIDSVGLRLCHMLAAVAYGGVLIWVARRKVLA